MPMSRGWTVIVGALLTFLALGLFFPLTFAMTMPLLGVLSAAWLFYKKELARGFDGPLLLWLAVIAALAFASILWADNPAGAQRRALNVVGLFAGCYPLFIVMRRMPGEAREAFQRIFPFVFLAAAAFFAMEFLTDYPLSRMAKSWTKPDFPAHSLNKNVAAITMLLPFAVYFCLRQKRYLLLGVIAAAVLIVLQKTDSQSAQLATLVMMVTAPTVHFFPRAVPMLGLAGILAILVLMPYISPVLFKTMAEPLSRFGGIMDKSSSSMRLENYDFIARKIDERPLTGFGIDATRFLKFDTEQVYFKANTIIHPHNLPLQVWIEFGMIGVAIFFCAFLFLALRIFTAPASFRVFACAIFFSMMVFMMVSWSMWANWLVAFIFAVASLLVMTGRGMGSHAEAS